MPAALRPYEEVLDRLFDVFQRLGYEGASLAELSRATGLGKSSLYHYFPDGKEGMGRAVLGRINEWMDAHILIPLRGSGAPRARLAAMLAALEAFYTGGKSACVLGNMVVGSSRRLFQSELQTIFGSWVQGLEALAVESGVPRRLAHERAEDAVVRIEGALVLAGGLDDPTPFRRALRHVGQELLQTEST